ISFRARHWLQSADDRRSTSAIHAVRGPDPSLYPRVGLARLLTEEFSKPVSDDAGAVQRFQNAVGSLVRHMRGIRCVPEQIVPIASCTQGIELAARLMLDPGDCVYVEEALDPCIRQSLELAGAQLVFMPCDGQGVDVTKASGPPPRLIIVCPSANFPLGRQMSELRRQAVIERAEAYGATILEWDRCWGLSYTGGRNPAIQAQARHGSVVYFDTFFESLGAHSRLGYLIVPHAMAEQYARMAEQTASGPASFLLSAVARFIEGHQFKVHLSSLRTEYARRLRRLSDLARASLDDVRVIEPNAGYTLAIEFPDHLDDVEICRSLGINLPVAPLSRFFHDPQRAQPAGLVIGAGAMTERMLESVVRQIGDALARARNSGIRSRNQTMSRSVKALSAELAS
ncbi:MAG TPA: PLP-dependent aminotransferase family protein, partial [Rhizomicrobium sp.]